MSEKLIIKKFGPIKNMELDLSKVLILIGPQSSGKSTIAKLVTILKSTSFIIKNETFEEALIKYGIDNYLEKDSFIQYSSPSYSFSYQQQTSKFELHVKHDFSKVLGGFKELIGNISSLKVSNATLQSLKGYIKILEEMTESEIPTSITEKRNSGNIKKEQKLEEIEISNLANKQKKEFLKFINYAIYIPAERFFISMVANSIMSLIKNKAPIPNLLLDFGAAFEKARKNIGAYNIDFLDVSYKHINNEDRVYLNKRKYIELSKASSGLQALIPLLMVIQDNLKNTTIGNIYVIEEPELNLYPEAQYELSKIISKICSKTNNKVVITTHSPYILTAFNNFLLANKLGDKQQIKEVEKILPKNIWVAQEDFNAYYVDGKKAIQIFNKKTGLIAENQLDNASELIMGDFDELMELYSNKLLNGHAN